MFLVGLALRNLTRHFRRNLLSTVAVVAGVWVLILGRAFIGGTNENIIRAAVDGLSGHAMLRPADYPTHGLTHPVDELLEVDDELVSFLDDEAKAWTERTMFAPTVVAGRDSLRVRAIGFDPERDPEVFPRTTWKVWGDSPETLEDGVLVGKGVARLLDVEPGDRVVLQTRTHAGAVNALDVQVAGVVTAGNSAIDLLGMFVPEELTEELLRTDKPSHLFARFQRREAADVFAERVQPLADSRGAEVRTWRQETADLMRIQSIRQKALDLIALVLMGMSATGIANVILMAAYERIRELGTLRAMGMTRPQVLGLFILEGMFIGLAGGMVGALIGGSMAGYWSVYPIDLSEALAAEGANIQISAFLYLQFSEATIAAAVLFGVLVAVLASVYPAHVASRMTPADAVRAD